MMKALYGPPPSWKDQSEYELKITEVNPLSDELFDKMTKHFLVDIDINDLTSEMVANLDTLVKNNPGNYLIKFMLKDPQFRTKVRLESMDVKVQPCLEVVSSLEEWGFTCHLV